MLNPIELNDLEETGKLDTYIAGPSFWQTTT